MKGIQFTLEEKQLLIEALLFTSCTDVCSEHTKIHQIKMLDLAKKLNTDVGPLHNVYVYPMEEDEICKLAVEQFNNLPHQDIIKD